MSSDKLNLLDCTLRDGGYYNNWEFDANLVNDYLGVMSKIGIKYVEIGFRSFYSKAKGNNWHTTDNYISKLNIPRNLKIVVMVNASELISKKNITKSTKQLFKKSLISKIHMVRIACHFHELKKSLIILNELKKLGYEVAINLMQISQQSIDNINKAGNILKKTDVSVVYFADSLGCMNEKNIKEISSLLIQSTNKPIGIHAHDNLGKAVDNNMIAINSGITWVDSTITGMGRGAGNAQTELFLLAIEKTYKKKVHILPLLKLINKFFSSLKNEYNWGTNPYYFMAGQYGIHPTYIQEMLTTGFNETEILEAINRLKENKKGSKYNVELVKSEFQTNVKLERGDWAPKTIMKNKEVLLVASGLNNIDYKEEIEDYILSKKPFVIAVNPNVYINKKLINVYTVSNPLKLMADSKAYLSLKKPIVLPKILLTEKLKKKFIDKKIYNFGVGLNQNSYNFYSNAAIIPRLYTLAYSLAVATSGKCKSITLAGFEGYGVGSRRNKIINELFSLYSLTKGSKKIIAITPTTYPVPRAYVKDLIK
tara:strand:+ start:110 stop:1723 length:1614 start_codon:yes stop_codon:yes gene_type:complete